MDTSPANEGPNAIDPPATSGDGPDSFFSGILTPGSSLNPTFLLIVDFSFVLLVAVLFSLLIATGGNLHFAALLLISLALWASVKWFVTELKKVREMEATSSASTPLVQAKEKAD